MPTRFDYNYTFWLYLDLFSYGMKQRNICYVHLSNRKNAVKLWISITLLYIYCFINHELMNIRIIFFSFVLMCSVFKKKFIACSKSSSFCMHYILPIKVNVSINVSWKWAQNILCWFRSLSKFESDLYSGEVVQSCILHSTVIYRTILFLWNIYISSHPSVAVHSIYELCITTSFGPKTLIFE